MEEMPLGFVVAFLLPFHAAGGAAVGVAIRRTVQGGFKLSNLFANGFLFLWGIIFGGIPLLFGLSAALGWFILIQLFVFLGAIIGVALAYEWLRDLYTNPGMFVATFGLVFFVVGMAMLTPMIGEGDSSELLLTMLFGGIGAILTLLGVFIMWRN